MPSPKQAEQVVQATVKMIMTWSLDTTSMTPDGKIIMQHAQVQPSCTGFFVGAKTGEDNGYIATAGHCLDKNEVMPYLMQQLLTPGATDPSGMPSGKSAQAVPAPTQPSMPLPDPKLRIQVLQPVDQAGATLTHPFDAHMIDFMPLMQGDYGLAKIDERLPVVPSLSIATAAPNLGDGLVSIGFGGSMDSDAIQPDQPLPPADNPFADPYATNPGQFAKDASDGPIQQSVEFGFYGGFQQPLGTGIRFQQTSAPLTAGMSGGPTVKMENGQPVAVGTNSYTRDTQPFNYFTNTGGLRDFLRDHGVVSTSPTTSDPSQPASQDPSATNNAPSTPVTVANKADLNPWANVPGWVGFSAITLAIATLLILIFGVIFGILLLLQRRNRPQPANTVVPTHEHPDATTVEDQ
jgi:hypothetical protein